MPELENALNTNADIFPKDWNTKSLDQICQKITTGRLDANAMVEDGEYPFFTCAKSPYCIDKYAFDSEALLISGNGAHVGYVHYYNGKFNAYQRTYVLTYFSHNIHFLKFFIEQNLQERIRIEVKAGNTPYITRGTLAEMSVALPHRSEQRAIATALSDVDALIDALDRLIAKKRDIKQATMQQLLTGETRLPGFEGEWETHQLGELGSFRKGQGIRKGEVQDEGLPCVRYGEIYTHYHDYVREFYSFISAQVAQNSQQMKYGDLLFAGSGETAEEIGKCVAYLGEREAYAGGDIVIFNPVGQDPKFLGYLLNHPYVAAQKSRMGQGDAVVHIQARHLTALELELPHMEEQQAIATILSDMDAEIEVLERRREKTRQIKQGMMQELLTGRTRLVEPEAAADDDSVTIEEESAE